MIRTIAKTLPLVNDVLIEKPKNEGWYSCFYYNWDLDEKDFLLKEDIFFFDGSNFRTCNLINYDGADWIIQFREAWL